MTVDVYTKPACGGCVATKKHLAKLGIEFTERELDDEIREAAMGNGVLAAPVVVIDGGRMWGGYRPDEIKALVG
ncbi:MAG: glutaredoxin-like protein NrdH [Schumannella sp.]|nr:glutaredoxin-like protein NrdH [Schumannella sp.]